MRNALKRLKTYLELCKIKISLSVVFSSVAGFLLASSEPGLKVIILSCGIFFLACGSCALNQYQERDIDALMTRTKGRPIPAGKIKPIHALYFSLIFAGLGLYVIYIAGGVTASAFGLCAVIWYNGIYTYMKRKSAFAAVPGAFIGAIPPLIGWVTGGGEILNSKILFFCFFFFMWQVPHFWLLLLHYSEDYERAGLPSLTRTFTSAQLVRIVRHWVFAAALSCLFISFQSITSTFLKTSLLLTSYWLIYTGIKYLKGYGDNRRLIYARINSYMVIVLLLVTIDKLALLGTQVPGF
jgi:protoheme IX farnesyltransferase